MLFSCEILGWLTNQRLSTILLLVYVFSPIIIIILKILSFLDKEVNLDLVRVYYYLVTIIIIVVSLASIGRGGFKLLFIVTITQIVFKWTVLLKYLL